MGWITVQIEEDLHKKIRIKAAKEGKDVKEVIVEAIERYVGEEE